MSEVERERARATVDAAIREIKVPERVGGTVTQFVRGPTGGLPSALVHLDGDPPNSSVQIPSLVGVVIPPGTRVAVDFHPGGAAIIGVNAAPGGHFLLASNRLIATAATLPIPNVPPGFHALELITNTAITTASPGPFRNGIQFNGDTAANYAEDVVFSATGGAPADTTAVAQTSGRAGLSSGNGAGKSGLSRIVIPDYADLVFQKTFFETAVCFDTAARIMESGASIWQSTAQITSMTLLPQSGSFGIGSSYALYGVGAGFALA